MNWPEVRDEAGRCLQLFIEKEVNEMRDSQQSSIVDCTFAEVEKFATELGVDLSGILADIEPFCLKKPYT